MAYLIHFNRNHSPKNGQFTSGDGDGDGINNDHAHMSKTVKRYSGENARANLAKDGSYKVKKLIEKEQKKRGYKSGRAQINADLKKAESIANKKFNALKKKDKTLDKYDLQDMIDNAYDKVHDYNKERIADIMGAGFDKKSAELINKYLTNPWIK